MYPQGWSCWSEGDFFGCTFRSWSALIIRISEGTLLMLNGNKRLYFEITLYIHIHPWIHTYISNACVWENRYFFPGVLHHHHHIYLISLFLVVDWRRSVGLPVKIFSWSACLHLLAWVRSKGNLCGGGGGAQVES